MGISAAPAAPARRATARKSSAPVPKAAPPAPPPTRAEALADLGKVGASIFLLRRQYANAGAMHVHWPPFAKEVDAVADQNEQVAKICDYIATAGPLAGVISAGITLAMQFAANAGKIDADKASGMAGILSPALLEKRVQAEVLASEKAIQAEIEYFETEAAKAEQSRTESLKEREALS